MLSAIPKIYSKEQRPKLKIFTIPSALTSKIKFVYPNKFLYGMLQISSMKKHLIPKLSVNVLLVTQSIQKATYHIR